MTSAIRTPAGDYVEAIADLARKADGAEGKIAIVPIEGDPQKNYLIVKPDGTYESSQLELSPRATILHSIDQVPLFTITAIRNWNAIPIVYYGPGGVEVRLDEEVLYPIRCGSAKVTLAPTSQWKLLQKFAADPAGAFMTQKSFIILLRIQMATCIDPDILASTLKALEAYESMEGERTVGVVSRNRESLGREIKAELKSHAGTIPEEISIEVRIFDDPALKSRRLIRCAIETDPTNGGRFALLPLAEQLQDALDNEMHDLGELLRNSINGGTKRLTGPSAGSDEESVVKIREVPVFYGSF